MAQDVLVELNNVYLKSDRGGQVFRDLSFTLKAGRSAVITGAAGSGKTSLAELLVGLQPVQSGSVEVMGQTIKPEKARTIKQVRRKIGGVGGIFGLMPSLTAAENILAEIESLHASDTIGATRMAYFGPRRNARHSSSPSTTSPCSAASST